MSLFKNDKKPCPICGGATPRLLSCKVEDQPICRDCENRLSMSVEKQNELTLDGVREHFAWRDANDDEKKGFTQTSKAEFGWSGGEAVFDATHSYFYFKESENGLLFHAEELVDFEIKEDDTLICRGNAQTCLWKDTDVRERVMAQSSQIAVSNMIDGMQKMTNKQNATDTRFSDPMRGWTITLHLNHPYQDTLYTRVDSPYWNSSTPDCAEYIRDYDKKIGQLKAFAKDMMDTCFPGVLDAARANAKKAEAAPQIDAMDQIKKLKDLLDMGAITEDEFAQKKKQLLGL